MTAEEHTNGEPAAKSRPGALASAAASKTKLGKAASFGKPAVEGTKDSAKQIAKDAAKGAATGGAIGAVRGAAIGFAKTKAGRRIITAILVIGLLFALSGPITVATATLLLTTSMSEGDGDRSEASVEGSGVEKPVLQEAANDAGRNGIPWPVYLAVQEESGEPVDEEKLRDALADIPTLGIGAVYEDKTGMVPGKKPEEESAAKEERELYLEALQKYGLTESESAAVYEQALLWFFGQVETCTAEVTVPPPPKEDEDAKAEVNEDEASVTFDLPDGGKRTLDATQIRNINTIIATADTIEGVNEDAVIVALMTSIVEANFRNYANSKNAESLTYPHDAVGKDHDSLGLFQQRLHWAPPSERDNGAKATAWLMDMQNQTKAFFGGKDGPNGGSPRGLLDIDEWETMPRGALAQKVQVSAYPDRYEEVEDFAVLVFERYSGATISGCSSGSAALTGEFAYPLNDPNWPLSSGFGPRNGSAIASKVHGGIDFAGSPDFCNMPIYSIADGTVEAVGVAGGYGNRVRINHGTFSSMYAHQPFGSEKYWPTVGQQVKAGDLIGRVGNTGNSEGCHLHFEIFEGETRIDPAPFIIDKLGLPLKWLETANGKVPDAEVVPWYVPDLSTKLD